MTTPHDLTLHPVKVAWLQRCPQRISGRPSTLRQKYRYYSFDPIPFHPTPFHYRISPKPYAVEY
ncbi:MAG: hypothetical protein AAGE59_12170 [Cyanobacteria bacterium P01_F01_bin.86]